MTKEALLVMDVQNGVVERFAERHESLLPTLAEAVAAARGAGVPVIFVRVAFRDGMPEVSPNNQIFSNLARTGNLDEGDASTQIHLAVAPQPGDIIVTKRRVSAFAGSDLDVVLRSLGVDALVLCGIATSGVVLSTLRQAADLDFRLTVLRDGCVDADEEVHRVLMDKLFPRQAVVELACEWVARLPSQLNELNATSPTPMPIERDSSAGDPSGFGT
jgi:nicotinamidase-related amidase